MSNDFLRLIFVCDFWHRHLLKIIIFDVFICDFFTVVENSPSGIGFLGFYHVTCIGRFVHRDISL